MMARLLIPFILGSFYFTLCAGGLSHILKGKSWLQGVELVAKPIVWKEGGMPMMEMKSNGNGMMENGKQPDYLKLLAVKSLLQESNGGNGGGEKSESKGWEVDDIKAWETPKTEEKEGNGKAELDAWKQMPPPPPPSKSEEEKWVLVQVKGRKMMMKPEEMEMKEPKGWQAEEPKWRQKPEAPVEEMMTMMKPGSKGWEPPMEPPKWKPEPQSPVEPWKPLHIKAWESPMEPPKMMTPESKGWAPESKGWAPESKGWAPESKGWEPAMQPPEMMMKPAAKGWESPMEPPKQEKWVLVKVKKPEEEMETSKNNEMQNGDPWKAAVSIWQKAEKSNGGGEAWKTSDTQERPFVLGYNSGLKSAFEERGSFN